MFTLIRHNTVLAGAAIALASAATFGGGAANAAVTGQAAPAAAALARTAVPWSQVGPGWTLGLVSAGSLVKAAPSTLYLASPGGVKYQVYKWPAKASVPNITAWSPSKTEVLFTPALFSSTYEELNLKTGKVTATLKLPAAESLQYTVPSGKQILVWQATSGHGSEEGQTLTLYSTSGERGKTIYTTVPSKFGAYLNPVYSPDGSKIAVYTANHKVGVLSSTGGKLKVLSVPGDTTKAGCWVERWWNRTTIFAGCGSTKGKADQQMWLVPLNGARPTALTPAAPGYNGAWQVKSGRYVQYQGNDCTSDRLDELAPNGKATQVNIPGLVGPEVLTSDGTSFLVTTGYCDTDVPVYWYNPATKASRLIFSNAYQIVPFVTTEDAQ